MRAMTVFGPKLGELEKRYGIEELWTKSIYDLFFFELPDLLGHVKGFNKFFAKCRWFSRA